jgi:hypothetical protein
MTVTVEKIIHPAPDPEYTFTVDKNTARALVAILGRVSSGSRYSTYALYDALVATGDFVGFADAICGCELTRGTIKLQ